MAEGRSDWNHNTHYHSVVLDAVPSDARTALDVGCGEGVLTRELAVLIPAVTGIDKDEAVLTLARLNPSAVEWVCGDALTADLDSPFDVVASVATLHHLPDLDVALRRYAELTAPGGVLAIVGLARGNRPSDLGWNIAGTFTHWWLSRTREYREHAAPTVWPPPHDFRTVRHAAQRLLPGVCWRRLALWRYALIWQKPR